MPMDGKFEYALQISGGRRDREKKMNKQFKQRSQFLCNVLMMILLSHIQFNSH